jgi:arginyl-tRNA synthetase
MKPRDIAVLFADALRSRAEVDAAEVAGPGFVNLRVKPAFWYARIPDILRAGAAYGDAATGQGAAVNVEYVSANPTGPMHIGHARGAVVGDALANLLAKVGYKVTREYYINDAGAQVDVLARSAYLRYREALGERIGAIPDGYYPGDYLKEVGAALATRDGARWREAPETEWLEPVRDFAIAAMLAEIKDDLAALGVKHDVFSSERALIASGAIEQVVGALAARDLVYTGVLEPPKGKPPIEDWEPRPQLLFRSTKFSDDVDRPLKKSDGSWTYFAPDIAYHFNKFTRGFKHLIDVWGADHKGYVKRMQAAVEAVTEAQATLDVRLCNLVNLMDKGAPVKMSKRAGTFVTLRDVVDQVGKDVVRFIMLTRSSDAPLDFDLAKVTEQSKDNPVFYVQYAHARGASVFRNVREAFPDMPLDNESLARADLGLLADSDELQLIKTLAGWPRVVEAAAEAHEPHRVAYYLAEVAAQFHGLWTRGNDDERLRFIRPGEPGLTRARLALVRAMQTVIASGLGVMGVTPVEELR